jgi:hypothetical protein
MKQEITDAISDAHSQATNPQQTASVFSAIALSKVPRAVRLEVEKLGWLALIRRYFDTLKTKTPSSPNQLMLDEWPLSCKRLVTDYGSTTVYVPSRGEHIPLLPSMITKAEVREGGDYLIAMGKDVTRAGNLLLQLAKKTW